jgi:flagellar hook-basal body protein
MNAGVMGLSVNSSKLATISDNIANSETKGYKRANIEFNSLVLTERPATYDAGGVRASTIREIDGQGALLSTRNATDLAISGRGFLPVTDIADVERGATNLPLKLLRTGAFRPDQNGVMQTGAGLVLMGWKAEADGTFSNLASSLQPVKIDSLSLAAEPTSVADVKVNLNADVTVTDPMFMSRMEYFDTLGKSRSVDFWFDSTGVANKWRMYVYEEGYTLDATTDEPNSKPTLAFEIEFETGVNNNPGGIRNVVEYDHTVLAGVTDADWAADTAGVRTNFYADWGDGLWEAGNPVNVGGEILVGGAVVANDAGGNVLASQVAGIDPAGFLVDADGDRILSGGAPIASVDDANLIDATGDAANKTWHWNAPVGDVNRALLKFPFNSGAEIAVTMGAQGSDENIVQFAADSQTLSIEKDGSPTATLTGIEIDETGLMDAIYDTGFRSTLYKIPVGNVQNPNGMSTQDGQAFALTRESGSVYFYDAGEGPTGALVSSALEESTTDVAEELTQLIKTQRAYSSNAKIIQTVDEMLQETTNLKR